MEVPTLRSAFMVVVAALATVLGRADSAPIGLALAALAIVYGSPGTVFEPGFQLSFVSVAALLGGAGGRNEGRSGMVATILAALRTSAVASLATAPLTALHFHQVSIIGVVANPIVIPFFGMIVLIPALLGAVAASVWASAALWLFWAAGLVVGPAVALVEWLGARPWAAADVPMPSAAEVIVVYAIIGSWWYWPRILPLAIAIGLATTVASELPLFPVPGHPRLRVTFLDVGQGDAAVVETPDGRVIIVDGGGFPGSDFDVGQAVVLPYLATRRIRHIDLVVVSHPHPDHFAGLPAVFLAHTVGEWWWNGVSGEQQWRTLETAAAAVPRVRPFPARPVPGWPDLRILHPPLGWTSGVNDGSIVFRLAHGAASILFTGDAELAAERAMLDADGLLAATVVKVPHHGSATSSTSAFLDRVAPRIAVISAGRDNRYGLPAAAVEARYAARGICVLRTDRCGAVSIETDGTTMTTTAVVPGCGCAPLTLRPPQ